MSATEVHYSSVKHDWSTPPQLFARLDREFGFTLDAAASQENAKCDRYFTPDDDGLRQDWGQHVVWCNPPYGRVIAQWVRKGFDAAQLGATVVMLVPARTDTAWWHDYAINGDVEFLRGRLNFGGDRIRGHNAPFPSCVVVFRPSPKSAVAGVPSSSEPPSSPQIPNARTAE